MRVPRPSLITIQGLFCLEVRKVTTVVNNKAGPHIINSGYFHHYVSDVEGIIR